MSKENQLLLYKHFKEIGKENEANEILKAYPEFDKKEETKEPTKKKAKKKKAKK